MKYIVDLKKRPAKMILPFLHSLGSEIGRFTGKRNKLLYRFG
jgi:hypothetical protein